jgi:hypothetical protein
MITYGFHNLRLFLERRSFKNLLLAFVKSLTVKILPVTLFRCSEAAILTMKTLIQEFACGLIYHIRKPPTPHVHCTITVYGFFPHFTAIATAAFVVKSAKILCILNYI